jgi:hypothetical protein
MRDPEEIGYELKKYLEERPKVPNGINPVQSNNIVEWLNK